MPAFRQKFGMTAMLAPDQSFDSTPGQKRTLGLLGAQIVFNLISAERRLKLFWIIWGGAFVPWQSSPMDCNSLWMATSTILK
jgi:hypothetical protein